MNDAVVAALLLVCCGYEAHAATRIVDPQVFVAQVYKRLIDSQGSDGRPYQPPEDIYTSRLKKLLDRNFTRNGIGCVDFGFWVNAQDWAISELNVHSHAVSSDRQTVVATFRNMGRAEKIQFDFRRVGTHWLVDDVESLTAVQWVLSTLLKCNH